MPGQNRTRRDGPCDDLARALGGILEWKWDGRFGTVLAEFPLESKAVVLGVLDQHLLSRWDSTSIADAPEAVKKVKEHLGGLMAGQLLWLSDPNTEPLVYCAWWPWGNGQRISIRIGLFSETMETGELTEVLQGLFGV